MNGHLDLARPGRGGLGDDHGQHPMLQLGTDVVITSYSIHYTKLYDHPIFLLGLEQLLARESDFQVLARCDSAGDSLREVHRHRPDLLLLDHRLPDREGLALIREMRNARLPTRNNFV